MLINIIPIYIIHADDFVMLKASKTYYIISSVTLDQGFPTWWARGHREMSRFTYLNNAIFFNLQKRAAALMYNRGVNRDWI